MAESTPGVRPPWFARTALPALLVLVALAVGATPKIVGDGGEYPIYAVSIAKGHLPPLSPRDLQEAGSSLARAAGGARSWDPQQAFIPAESGRGDFAHFWFYPALAAPGALVARLAGVDPVWSFVLLNVALLFLAWRVAVARFGWAVSLLVCGGPVLWWTDKVHTEAFTFALLTIAVASLRSRPWLSLVAIGAAATQNPPIAALLVPFTAAGLWITRARLNWRQTIAGLAGGVLARSAASAVLPPRASARRASWPTRPRAPSRVCPNSALSSGTRTSGSSSAIRCSWRRSSSRWSRSWPGGPRRWPMPS